MYQFISDYRNNKKIRASFNTLATQVFELDFSPWYNSGYWDDSYIPYSLMDGDTVIANASVAKMTVVIHGKTYHAIQIGTVMTAEKYRQQGLAKQLLHYIIDKYEKHCDFIYLFANDTVLDFYPQFGFERIYESVFSIDLTVSEIASITTNIQQLNMANDAEFLQSMAKQRSHGQTLDVQHNESLLLFYFTIALPDAISYIPDLATVVLMEEDATTLHIFAIIATTPVTLEAVIARIRKPSTTKVVLYFTPDVQITGLTATTFANDDDALFILSKKPILHGHFMFPLTSHC